MADKKENPTKKAVELSKKELAEKRDEITNYYKDHIPHLQTQLEYENLLRDIEKSRAERMQAQMYVSKMADTPPMPEMPKTSAANRPVSPKVVKPEVKRTLKKAVKSE